MCGLICWTGGLKIKIKVQNIWIEIILVCGLNLCKTGGEKYKDTQKVDWNNSYVDLTDPG